MAVILILHGASPVHAQNTAPVALSGQVSSQEEGLMEGVLDVQFDEDENVWVGNGFQNAVQMFDPQTEKFQTWSLGIPEYYAYEVWLDKNGEAWASTEYADRVVRLKPATGEVIPYLLPGETNMRRANGDNRSTPVNFWVGATHTASIVRLEPLE